MSVLIHNELESALRIRRLYRCLHGSQKQIRPYDSHQLAIAVDRHRAHDPHVIGKGIDLHIREDQLSRFHGLLIPGTGARIIAGQRTGFIILGLRPVVRNQERSFRQRNKTGVGDFGCTKQGDHHI